MRAKNLAMKNSIRSEIIYPKDDLGPHSRSTEFELTILNILPNMLPVMQKISQNTGQ